MLHSGAVLGAVKAASRGSATAFRGASDLDRACAQLVGWHSRDGPIVTPDSAAGYGWQDLFDGRFDWRYSAITSLMPYGIPFTSPDVRC